MHIGWELDFRGTLKWKRAESVCSDLGFLLSRSATALYLAESVTTHHFAPSGTGIVLCQINFAQVASRIS